MKRKISQFLIIVMTVVLVLSGCSSKTEEIKSDSEVLAEIEKELIPTLSQEKVTLSKKDTISLKLENAKAKEWKTSDEKIATVSKKGLVTAVEDGECVISVVTEKNDTFKCQIIVKTVELSAAEITMGPGTTFQLEVKNAPGVVTWASADEAIATIDANGLITAVAVGETSILADCGKSHFEASLKVEEGVTEVQTVAPENSTNKKATSAGKNESTVVEKSEASSINTEKKEEALQENKKEQAASGNNSSSNSNAGNNKPGNSSEIKACSHKWKSATCTEPKTCTKCGETEGVATGHNWSTATCSQKSTCSNCGETKGEKAAHNYQWVTTREAAVGVDGLKEYKCTACGAQNGSETIPALQDVGQETPWNYTDSTHRTKTMYDGTVINEVKISYGGHSLWGWFDYGSSSSMMDAVNYSLSQVDGWSQFVVDSSYQENAKIQAFGYALKGSCSKAYHANFGALPNVDNDKRYITLSDARGQNNYIMCFVRDGYQQDGDETYGQYWRSYFGTYYASGNF